MKKPILLAEDDPNDQWLMGYAWKTIQGELPLQTVHNGAQVIEYLDGKGEFSDRARFPLPGMLLLDLRMPVMGGFEVLEWLRSRPEFREIPVIILSASRQRDDVRRAYCLGANSYLVKPSDLDELVDMMRDVRQYWFKRHVFPD